MILFSMVFGNVEHICTRDHVFVLWIICPWTSRSEVSLVEEVPDPATAGKYNVICITNLNFQNFYFVIQVNYSSSYFTP